MRSIEWWHCGWPWVTHYCPKLPPIFTFCTAIHIFVTAACRYFKFGISLHRFIIASAACRWKIFPERGEVRVRWRRFKILHPCEISPQRLTLETSNLVHRSAIWSLSLVMSECSLSGRGQGHVSNFYIVDFENFATASRWYTNDIHNSSVVGLFMTPIGQWKRLDRVMVECTCLLHIAPL